MDTDQLNDEQLYYKEKYFKYKLKYLALKEQLGGRYKIYNDDIAANYLTQGLLLVKNQATKKLGGFDKKKFISYLETDLLKDPLLTASKQDLYDTIKKKTKKNRVTRADITIFDQIKNSINPSTEGAIDSIIDAEFGNDKKLPVEAIVLKMKLKNYLKDINNNYQK